MSDMFPRGRLENDEVWRARALYDNLKVSIDTVLLENFAEGEEVEYCIGPEILDRTKVLLVQRYQDFEVCFETDQNNNLWIKLC